MRRSFLGGPPARGEALPEGRGASLSAKPCSFVVKHHVFGAQGAAGVPDVVLRSPQTLVPSSSSTTSSRLKAPATYRTWCFTPRKTLFLRRQAPRLPDPRRRRLAGRGASLPANPCSIVGAHHVFQAQGAAGWQDVVLHSPQNLVLRRQAPRLWIRMGLRSLSHPKSDA